MRGFLFLSSLLIFQFAYADIASVVTDVSKECVVISNSTEKAPIDFYEAACKSFGGYNLSIAGGDIRYSPRLSYGSSEISLDIPGSFHDMASNQVEWIYDLQRDEEGSGVLQWRGLIYSLSVYNNDTQKDEIFFYAVKLDGDKSCSLGQGVTRDEVAKLIETSTSCK